jgi:prepilin-type N-terminal cleavage/methylation domain-containing protein
MKQLIRKNRKNFQGFTLIELLVVITVISTLAVVVFVALNPAQRLKDARDARRVNDVQSILTAIHEYTVDNKGSLPTGLTAGMSEAQLGSGASGCTISTGGCSVSTAACVNLTTPLAKYLKSIPVDPLGGSTYTSTTTGYSVVVDTNGIVTVKACGTEGSNSVSASR